MDEIWKSDVDQFIRLAHKNEIKMLLVGGGAVNFYGYRRHSADVDFWIDNRKENLDRLLKVLREIGFEIEDFPLEVKEQSQNISITPSCS